MPSTRRFTPTGLGNRSALILFVPVFVILLGMTWYYYDFHIRQVDRTLTGHVARDIALYLDATESDASLARALIEQLRTNQEIAVVTNTTCPADAFLAPNENPWRLRDHLDDFIEAPFLFNVDRAEGMVTICVEPAGSPPVAFEVLRKRLVVINSHIFIVWVLLAGILMTLIAYGFLRNQVRSILRLTEAAKAFGRGRDMPDYKPSGASEIRDAARAVIDMKRRLTAAADQRTSMLAGVSHDLRTPLTRLKLEVAMMPKSEDSAAMQGDIADMEALLDEYLSFAKGEDGETPVPIDAGALVDEVAENFRHAGLTAGPAPSVTVTARRVALKRAINNLVQNALDHADAVTLSLSDGPRWLDVLVDDNGPGIDADQREEALQPFSRLDPARTQNTAGAGLGLAIASDVARSHGGELRLETSPSGGLRARLRLPH